MSDLIKLLRGNFSFYEMVSLKSKYAGFFKILISLLSALIILSVFYISYYSYQSLVSVTLTSGEIISLFLFFVAYILSLPIFVQYFIEFIYSQLWWKKLDMNNFEKLEMCFKEFLKDELPIDSRLDNFNIGIDYLLSEIKNEKISEDDGVKNIFDKIKYNFYSELPILIVYNKSDKNLTNIFRNLCNVSKHKNNIEFLFREGMKIDSIYSKFENKNNRVNFNPRNIFIDVLKFLHKYDEPVKNIIYILGFIIILIVSIIFNKSISINL